MSLDRFEDLWNSGSEGASTPFPLTLTSGYEDQVELLDAWSKERKQAIEFELLLNESRRLIRGMLSENRSKKPSKKAAQRLILAIERSLREAASESS